MLLFTAGPLLASLYLSFTNFDLLQPPAWIGFENYIDLLTLDPLPTCTSSTLPASATREADRAG
ncbi:hypothetical protein ACQ7C1_30710, partial [Rhizobium sp. Nf11,1]